MDYDRPFIVIRDAFSKKRGLLSEAIEFLKVEDCSGSMIPDTHQGGNIAILNEVSDDQKTTFFFA
jgi:hypothetical protein